MTPEMRTFVTGMTVTAIINGSLEIPCAAVCFDMDGVLVDSADQMSQVITRWAAERAVSLEGLRSAAASMTDREFVALAALHLDAEAEAAAIQRLEVELAVHTRPLPGALLAHTGVPRHARAVVTSGARGVATARLAAAGIPAPAVLVTADDVEHGKPHPQPYADAVRRLGRPAGHCVAIEDTANGARSARRAGLTVIGVGTRDPELSATADHVIGGMRDLTFTSGHTGAIAA